jgi:biotin carboxylase
VFLCNDAAEAGRAFSEIREGLSRRRGNRLYAGSGLQIMAETYVSGPEYSCDFVLEDARVRIVRLARKIRVPGGPFGAIRGYVVPADLPGGVRLSQIEGMVEQAARSLKLPRTLCMVDFIVGPAGPVLLELAPRPGGDCLPPLIRHAAGVDMLGFALDVAEGWPIDVPDWSNWKQCVGLRIHARQQGVLTGMDVGRIMTDPRVSELHLSRQPGHVVVLPPVDYDSWILGYLIFSPESGRAIELQCEELLADVRIAMGEAA